MFGIGSIRLSIVLFLRCPITVLHKALIRARERHGLWQSLSADREQNGATENLFICI